MKCWNWELFIVLLHNDIGLLLLKVCLKCCYCKPVDIITFSRLKVSQWHFESLRSTKLLLGLLPINGISTDINGYSLLMIDFKFPLNFCAYSKNNSNSTIIWSAMQPVVWSKPVWLKSMFAFTNISNSETITICGLADIISQ